MNVSAAAIWVECFCLYPSKMFRSFRQHCELDMSGAAEAMTEEARSKRAEMQRGKDMDNAAYLPVINDWPNSEQGR
jgi:hypothetical protein